MSIRSGRYGDLIERTEVSFPSGDERCAGWFYPQLDTGRAPVVVLAHGFGLVREARLDAYAERFAAAGMACLVFDYRHFGASGGTPRQLLDISRQLADWRAAIDYARGLPGVDPGRLALWGTSFSGGHVARLASEQPGISAVVSQVPYAGLGGRGGPPRIAFLARMLLAAVYDEVRGRLGRSPATIQLVAEPGPGSGPPWRRRATFAAFQRPGAPALMQTLLPEQSTWVNAYTPRVALRMPRYRPFDDAAGIGCPWLVMVADHDDVTPPEQATRLAQAAPRVEIHRLATGHFQVYTGEWFEHAVEIHTDFLRRHLLDTHQHR